MAIRLIDNRGGRETLTGTYPTLAAALDVFAASRAAKNGDTIEFDGERIVQKFSNGKINVIYTFENSAPKTNVQKANKLFGKYNVSANLNTKMDSEFCDF